jgi:hypothetical protein
MALKQPPASARNKFQAQQHRDERAESARMIDEGSG